MLSSCKSLTKPSQQVKQIEVPVVQAKEYKRAVLPYSLKQVCKDPEQLQSTHASEVFRVLSVNSLELQRCKAKHKALLGIASTLYAEPAEQK